MLSEASLATPPPPRGQDLPPARCYWASQQQPGPCGRCVFRLTVAGAAGPASLAAGSQNTRFLHERIEWP